MIRDGKRFCLSLKLLSAEVYPTVFFGTLIKSHAPQRSYCPVRCVSSAQTLSLRQGLCRPRLRLEALSSLASFLTDPMFRCAPALFSPQVQLFSCHRKGPFRGLEDGQLFPSLDLSPRLLGYQPTHTALPVIKVF